ncbi:unnamed protein product [Darwinula stevensoni]|uniref:XK-related protein n=1 Tax=Darwinula stevensoni TaxID=69355 RepID=A0A7R8ZY88_9CRUS|nr:unnamed protein product [Darwinula stevensoni]CAG0879932.1 unnamed protein product [Darwinula stevensoni]
MCHKEKKKQDDFGIFEASLVLFSLGTLFIDIDAILVYKYIFDYGFITWGWLTLGLALVPSIVVHFFSLRWYIYDGESSAVIWLLHFSQLGILHRYLVVLKTGFEAAVMNHRDTFQRLYQQQRDISMLRLFESFMESAPQLLLQGYIIIVADDWHAWTGACSMLVYYRYFHPSGPIQVEFCCWRVKATPQKPQHNLQPSGLKFWSPPISRGDTLRPYDFKGSYIPTTRYQEESEPDGKVIHIPHATSFPNLECHQGSKASIQHATMYPGIQCASIYGSSLPNIHNSTPHSSSHFMGSMVPCWSEVILSSIPICSQPLRKSQTYAGFEEQLSDFLPNHEFETSVDESKCNYFLSGEEPSLDTSHTFEKISQKTMSLTCEEMKNEHNYALIDRTDQSNISKTGKVSQLIQQFETSVSFL